VDGGLHLQLEEDAGSIRQRWRETSGLCYTGSVKAYKSASSAV